MNERPPHLNKPKLRWPLDLSLHNIDGQSALVLRDPLGVSAEPLPLRQAAGQILAYFDGNHTLAEIAAKLSHLGVSEELIVELSLLLDRQLYLVSPASLEARAVLERSFKEASVRECVLAGLSYPKDREQLEIFMARLIGGVEVRKAWPAGRKLGLAAPHIDYRRGETSYAFAYNNFELHRDSLTVLIGPTHQYCSGLFHLSAKHFATPFGELQTDVDLVKSVAAAHGVDRSFAEEILHRREHSLELQLPFLGRVLNDSSRIFPLLVGGFYEFYSTGREPDTSEEYDSFLSALSEAIAAERRKKRAIQFVAGVDMAHVGRDFGDTFPLKVEYMDKVAERDHQYLRAVVNQDKRSLFHHVAEDANQRRICGFSSLYTIIDLCDRMGIRYEAAVLDYRQALSRERESAVTFAAVAFSESE